MRTPWRRVRSGTRAKAFVYSLEHMIYDLQLNVLQTAASETKERLAGVNLVPPTAQSPQDPF